MRDVLTHLDRWRAEGVAAATATVVSVTRSAPRPAGATMAVAADGRVEGMVSGGCVEGAVVLAAEEVLRGGPPRLLHFGIADERAWEVGLPCGGEITVWVARAAGAEHDAFAALARTGARGALVTRLDDGRRLLVPDATSIPVADRPESRSRPSLRMGTLGDAALDAAAADAAHEQLALERSAQRELLGVPVLVDVTVPPPRLLIVGAVDLAAALCRIARVSGWTPFVIDPRARFATPERFPAAARVLAAWPAAAFAQLAPLDRGTAVAVLTHDPKIDDAALVAALRSDAGYVGAMGSRLLQARRRERLRAAGLTDAELEPLNAPIGLDLGALSVEETALAVMAEVVAQRNGRDGGRLRDAAGRIHEVEA